MKVIHIIGKNAAGKSTFVKKILDQLEIKENLYRLGHNSVHINDVYNAIYIGSMRSIEYNSGSKDEFFKLLHFALDLSKKYDIRLILFNQGQMLFSFTLATEIYNLKYDYKIYNLYIDVETHIKRLLSRGRQTESSAYDLAKKQHTAFNNFYEKAIQNRIPIQQIYSEDYDDILNQIVEIGKFGFSK